ncbi:MAG: HNH endonuclease [Bacilli bacterium]|nr:HNH endonuclease [Bacilli bacterium]
MKKIKINNYWLERYYWLEEDLPTCFVCGKETKLEKCHLIPKVLGGTDEVDNLVLLCRKHHQKAPNTSFTKDIMLNWIEEEAEKYDKLTNMKKDDVNIIAGSIIKMRERLIEEVEDKNDLIYIKEFISETSNEKIIFVPSHTEADETTITLAIKYLSEYERLELDYLRFLLKNKLEKN